MFRRLPLLLAACVALAACGGDAPVESGVPLPLIPVPAPGPVEGFVSPEVFAESIVPDILAAAGPSDGSGPASGSTSGETRPGSSGASSGGSGSLTDPGVPLVGERPESGLVVPPPPPLPVSPPPRPSQEDIASGNLTQAQIDEVIGALRAVTGFFNADQGSLEEKVAFVQNGDQFADYMSSVRYLANRPGVFAKVSKFELVYEGGCSQVPAFAGVPVPEPCMAVELEFWQGEQLVKPGLVVYVYRAPAGWRLAQESFCYVAWSASPSDPPCRGY